MASDEMSEKRTGQSARCIGLVDILCMQTYEGEKHKDRPTVGKKSLWAVSAWSDKQADSQREKRSPGYKCSVAWIGPRKQRLGG